MERNPNNRGRLALCTEFGASHWRMIFLDTLEECKVPPFANAKRGRWFAQSEDGKWQMVDASAFPELELFEVQLEGVDKQCCLKIRMPVFFPQRFDFMGQCGSETFISRINPSIKGNVLCGIGNRHRQTVFYWAYISLTSFNTPVEDADENGLQWSIRSEADILGPYEQCDQQEVEEEEEAESQDDSSPEEAAKIQPYQPNWSKEEGQDVMRSSSSSKGNQKEGQQMANNPTVKQIQSANEANNGSFRCKIPAEVEGEQQKALVLCWKRSKEDSFLCEWNSETKRFQRRLQAGNKQLNDDNIKIQAGDWYQILFAKYGKSGVHIVVVECKQVLETPLGTRIRNGIIQLNIAVKHVRAKIFQSVPGEISVREIPSTLYNRSAFIAWCRFKPKRFERKHVLCFVQLDESVASQQEQVVPQLQEAIALITGGDEANADIETFEELLPVPDAILSEVFQRTQPNQCRIIEPEAGSNAVRIKGPKQCVRECYKQMKSIRDQLLEEKKEKFSPSGKDKAAQQPNSGKSSSASSRASTPARAPKTPRMEKPFSRLVMTIPKKYHGLVVGTGASLLHELELEFGVELIVPRKTTQSDEVYIEGPDEEQTSRCKQKIQQILRRNQDFRNNQMITRKVSIPEKEHDFMKNHLKKIGNKFCVECRFHNNYILLTGDNEVDLDAAERELLAFRPVTKNHEIMCKYRQELLANGEEILRAIEEEYKVRINVQKPQEEQRTVQLTVVGPKENVDRCIAFLPIIRLINVPVKFHVAFMGNDGKLVKQIQNEYLVDIHFGFVPDSPEDVAVVGEAILVDYCIKEIQQKMAEMEAEKVEDSFELVEELPDSFHDQLEVNISELEHLFNVKIKLDSDNGMVTLRGKQDSCENCWEHIQLQLIRAIEQEEMPTSSTAKPWWM